MSALRPQLDEPGQDAGLALKEGLALALGLGQVGHAGAEALALALGFDGAGMGLAPVPPGLLCPVDADAGTRPWPLRLPWQPGRRGGAPGAPAPRNGSRAPYSRRARSWMAICSCPEPSAGSDALSRARSA
jgi:hypothetical protein